MCERERGQQQLDEGLLGWMRRDDVLELKWRIVNQDLAAHHLATGGESCAPLTMACS